jgi:hypothetical protein
MRNKVTLLDEIIIKIEIYLGSKLMRDNRNKIVMIFEKKKITCNNLLVTNY